ncbi:hypothetical protein ACROYT_G007623 [Oculina patagonica]
MAGEFVKIYRCCCCVAMFTLVVLPFIGFCEAPVDCKTSSAPCKF